MAKKNKKNQITDAETLQEDTILSDEIGSTEETEDNMEENAVTEEIDTDIPSESVSEESGVPAVEETAAGEASVYEDNNDAPGNTPAASFVGSVGTITRPVNFRTGPGFGRASITELKPGTTVVVSGSVEGDKGTWYECEFDGRKGYVKATGVTIKG